VMKNELQQLCAAVRIFRISHVVDCLVFELNHRDIYFETQTNEDFVTVVFFSRAREKAGRKVLGK
jgi:hypothetical protein